VQSWKVSVLLRNLAPQHLQEKWFKRLLADPQFLLAHCLTEPRGASDRWLPYNVPEAAMQTRAVWERTLLRAAIRHLPTYPAAKAGMTTMLWLKVSQSHSNQCERPTRIRPWTMRPLNSPSHRRAITTPTDSGA
jgi:hypothetical protein